MKIAGAIAVASLLLLPGCPKQVKPDEEPTATGLKITVEAEGPWIAVARPIDPRASVEAGLALALQEAVRLRLAPAGDPLVIYDGDGQRLVAFPVAGPARLEAPWFMRNIEGGPVATTTVTGGLPEAAARNEDFLHEIRALGHHLNGAVLHRVLDDPRTTEPSRLRVQLLAPITR